MRRLPVPAALDGALARYRAMLSCAPHDVHCFDEVRSTNSVAGDLAVAGAPEGTVVLARSQSAGRGRLGRAWHSHAGTGLYFSVLFRPAVSPGAGAPDVTLLTLAAGVGVAEGLATATGVAPALKWPNDLVTERLGPDGRRAFRKLGGILAEASVSGGEMAHIVLGIGVNLITPAAPDLRNQVTSVGEELGRAVEGEALLAAMLTALAAAVLDLRHGRMASVLDRWRRLSPSARGRSVEWVGPGGPVHGRTAGIDASGALLIEHAGRHTAVGSGEVRWL
jgi:BirA family transcriptional regulator, biotin operon repressor / biotin---[acetyl-CoA-carboxylase] ligase